MMLHVRKFIEACVKHIDWGEPVYEFGAYQVQKSDLADLRPLFPGRDFVGSDISDGPGVDVILDVTNIDLPDGSIGGALCVETLEHVNNPILALEEIHRVLDDDGWVIISSVFNFPIHAWPYDYWRFTTETFEYLLRDFRHVIVDWNEKKLDPKSIVGVGFKGDVDAGLLDALTKSIGATMLKIEEN
jgi:SAM-dependent methyltransferase